MNHLFEASKFIMLLDDIVFFFAFCVKCELSSKVICLYLLNELSTILNKIGWLIGWLFNKFAFIG